jgi:uncharacterized protein YukE
MAPPLPPVPQSAGFDVQPAALIGAAGTFDAEAEALARAAARVQARLAALGSCWGDDDVGARFGATYEPAMHTVVGNVGALASGLIRIAAALRAVATAYEVVDSPVITPRPEVPTPRPPAGYPQPWPVDPGVPEVPTPRPPAGYPQPWPWPDARPPAYAASGNEVVR